MQPHLGRIPNGICAHTHSAVVIEWRKGGVKYRQSGREEPASQAIEYKGKKAAENGSAVADKTTSSIMRRVGPGAEAPGSVSTVTLPQDAYAARRASMTTLSLAFRVLAKYLEQGLPAPNRSSPYRRSRDPFTAQSILFRPHQKRITMRFWWRRRSTALRVLKRYYEPVIKRRIDIEAVGRKVQIGGPLSVGCRMPPGGFFPTPGNHMRG